MVKVYPIKVMLHREINPFTLYPRLTILFLAFLTLLGFTLIIISYEAKECLNFLQSCPSALEDKTKLFHLSFVFLSIGIIGLSAIGAGRVMNKVKGTEHNS